MAVKFKLKQLKAKGIRYDGIYKNLLRDVRKYFLTDFKQKVDYLNFRKNEKKLSLLELKKLIELYIKKFIFKPQMKELSIDFAGLTFFLSALIFTKETLQQYQSEKLEIQRIYNFLYGFSVSRLQQIINNPSFSILNLHYYMENGV